MCTGLRCTRYSASSWTHVFQRICDTSDQEVQRPDVANNIILTSAKTTSFQSENSSVNRWVILSTTNYAFINFTRNWLISLHRCGIRNNITVIAEDSQAFGKLKDIHTTKLDIQLVENKHLPPDNLPFKSEHYLRLVNRRPTYILNLLLKGIDVLFSDVDTVWLQNPFQYFIGEFDVYFEYDQIPKPGKSGLVCAGFVYYNATNATINFLKQWVAQIERKPSIPDQELLNDLLSIESIRTSLKILLLNPKQFPNGQDFFNDDRKNETILKPVVVHNNWIKGRDVKIKRFKEHNMWYLP